MVDIPILLIIAVVFLIIGGGIMGVVMLRAAVLSRLNPPLEQEGTDAVLQPKERTMTPTMTISSPTTTSAPIATPTTSIPSTLSPKSTPSTPTIAPTSTTTLPQSKPLG